MLVSALATNVKRNVLRGVCGALTLSIEVKGLNPGLRLCGLGRKTVGMPDMLDEPVGVVKWVMM